MYVHVDKCRCMYYPVHVDKCRCMYYPVHVDKCRCMYYPVHVDKYNVGVCVTLLLVLGKRQLISFGYL